MKKKIKQNKEFERYSLYQKLSLIQSEIGAISKDSKNPFTLQSLLALQAVDDDGNLASHGIVPFKNEDNYKKKSKPILLDNTPQFKNALEAISKRGKTINDIKEHYIINKEIEKKLLNFKI